jgi:hypothetical protein
MRSGAPEGKAVIVDVCLRSSPADAFAAFPLMQEEGGQSPARSGPGGDGPGHPVRRRPRTLREPSCRRVRDAFHRILASCCGHNAGTR